MFGFEAKNGRAMKKAVCIILAAVMLCAAVSCGKSAGIDYLVLVNKENKLPVGNVAPPAAALRKRRYEEIITA